MKVKVIKTSLKDLEKELNEALLQVPGRVLSVSQILEIETHFDDTDQDTVTESVVVYTTIGYKG